jgi:hypothetical protein
MADLQADLQAPEADLQAEADLQDVHTVLETCGMPALDIRTRFINLEGFENLGKFNIR